MGINCDECDEPIRDGEYFYPCSNDKCPAGFCQRCYEDLKLCPECDEEIPEETP